MMRNQPFRGGKTVAPKTLTDPVFLLENHHHWKYVNNSQAALRHPCLKQNFPAFSTIGGIKNHDLAHSLQTPQIRFCGVRSDARSRNSRRRNGRNRNDPRGVKNESTQPWWPSRFGRQWRSHLTRRAFDYRLIRHLAAQPGRQPHSPSCGKMRIARYG